MDQMRSLNRKDHKKKVRGNADPKISSLSSQITDIINRVTVREGTGLETIINDSFGGNVQLEAIWVGLLEVFGVV